MAKLKFWWEYLCFIFTWWGLMSGGTAIPFTVAGLMSAGHPKTYFIALAFLGLLVASAGAAKRNIDIRETLRPKLRFKCSPNIALCRLVDPLDTYCAYRVRVRNSGRESVTQCKARLTGIYRGTETLCEGESPLLNFAQDHEDDSQRKTLEYDHPYPLDVLFVHKDGLIKMGASVVTEAGTQDNWPFKSPWRIFTDHGTYLIKVSVSANPLQSVKLELRFNWTGDYAKSELWLDKIEPEEARDLT